MVAKFASIKKEIKKLSSEDFRNEIEEVKTNISDMSDKKSEIESEKSKLEKELEDLRKKLQKCENELEDAEGDLSEAKEDLDTLIDNHYKKVQSIADTMDSFCLKKNELDKIAKMAEAITNHKNTTEILLYQYNLMFWNSFECYFKLKN